MNSDARSTGFGWSVSSVTRGGRRSRRRPAGAAPPRLHADSVSREQAPAVTESSDTRCSDATWRTSKQNAMESVLWTRPRWFRIRVKQQRPRRGGRGLVGCVEPDELPG